jgi:predicted Zn-dependent protease
LAGVLGHECGHVALQHNIKGMQEQMGASVLADLAGKVAGADKAEAAKTAAKVVGSMATLKYSRTYEYEADGMGVEYLSRAGYNPWGMVEVLQVLAGLSDKKVGWLEEKFQTHPDTGSRIKEAENKVKRISQAPPTGTDPNVDKFMEMRKLLTPSMMK